MITFYSCIYRNALGEDSSFCGVLCSSATKLSQLGFTRKSNHVSHFSHGISLVWQRYEIIRSGNSTKWPDLFVLISLHNYMYLVALLYDVEIMHSIALSPLYNRLSN